MSDATEDPIWVVRQSYGFIAVELVRETAQCIFYRGERFQNETRADKSKFVDWRGTEAQARRLAEKLTAARETLHQKRLEANNWFQAEKARLIAEQSPTSHGGAVQ